MQYKLFYFKIMAFSTAGHTIARYMLQSGGLLNVSWEVDIFIYELKGALSDLTQILATVNSLQMMKNAFYFTLKALIVLKIFEFLSWLFGHVGKTNWLET